MTPMFDLTPLVTRLARTPDLKAVAVASGLSKKTLDRLLTKSCNTTFRTANKVAKALDEIAQRPAAEATQPQEQGVAYE